MKVTFIFYNEMKQQTIMLMDSSIAAINECS